MQVPSSYAAHPEVPPLPLARSESPAAAERAKAAESEEAEAVLRELCALWASGAVRGTVAGCSDIANEASQV